jgi:hypothetical protein
VTRPPSGPVDKPDSLRPSADGVGGDRLRRQRGGDARCRPLEDCRSQAGRRARRSGPRARAGRRPRGARLRRRRRRPPHATARSRPRPSPWPVERPSA